MTYIFVFLHDLHLACGVIKHFEIIRQTHKLIINEIVHII